MKILGKIFQKFISRISMYILYKIYRKKLRSIIFYFTSFEISWKKEMSENVIFILFWNLYDLWYM